MSYDWISNSGHFGGGGCCIWLSRPGSQDLSLKTWVAGSRWSWSLWPVPPQKTLPERRRTDARTHTQFVIIYKIYLYVTKKMNFCTNIMNGVYKWWSSSRNDLFFSFFIGPSTPFTPRPMPILGWISMPCCWIIFWTSSHFTHALNLSPMMPFRFS